MWNEVTKEKDDIGVKKKFLWNKIRVKTYQQEAKTKLRSLKETIKTI